MMRWLKWMSLSLGLLVMGSAALVYWGLQRSLPALEGELLFPELSMAVTIERDRQGIPTIRAQNRQDLAFATGFVHAQERFFQMDLQRRLPAGELAALVGRAAIDVDKANRIHRFRYRAQQALSALPTEHQAILSAYTQGVNQGLRQLARKPFEYDLLRQQPLPWQPEDALLTLYAMYLDLQEDDGYSERLLAAMYRQLPSDLVNYFTSPSPSWDAPIAGGELPMAALPDSSMPAGGTLAAWQGELPSDDESLGSNNWAAGGAMTDHGSAIVADDMHLSLNVPNIWYRASLMLPDRNLVGATLPGTPVMVVGSNGGVAWGFTNSYADYSDVIRLNTRRNEAGQEEYLTPAGWLPITTVREEIAIAGEVAVMRPVRETIWGPIIGADSDGTPLALRWVAHDIEGANLALLNMERIRTVPQALALAPSAGIPGQNLMVGDSEGNIGWTIIGRLPNRIGLDGRLPTDWSDGSRRWDGYLPAADYPRVLNPEHHRLWTANARVVTDDGLQRLGEGGYALGARARQIRDGLMALDTINEADMLDIQLDDRALFLQRWHALALELSRHPDAPAILDQADVTRQLQQWAGRASTDSSSYYLVREFRLQVLEQLTAPLRSQLAPWFEGLSARDINLQLEDAAWQLLQQQPTHLLPDSYTSWDALLLDALSRSTRRLAVNEGEDTRLKTWGERNTSQIRHPLSAAIPVLGQWLNMPAQTLDGDTHMPRVQGRDFGASQRMVVAPGHEDQGYFHMPAGQSGHPLSPYFGAGHSDWAEGKPSPFLPGAAKWVLHLQPETARNN